ncbi:MAG: PIG-L family deacetylase [Candidatus Marinimicrobia bacterium]|nr:PIG-L family deacetylase [Candidatus Neomarinimicrobiota bacterium]
MGSKVEEHYLAKSGRKLRYTPTEKIAVIQVDNFPDLGKLAALRFLEWVLENPEGVISLPTGKTPEYFIKQVNHFLADWDDKKVKAELEEVGISSVDAPDMSGLHFVQIDEFYPMNPQQRNSFYYYVSKYYIDQFGLDPNKALLINTFDIPTANSLPLYEIFPDDIVELSLRTDYAKTKLEKLQKESIELVDQFCTEYEAKIRELGGIGFFLGGIGPDGHIGFNVRGSDHFSVTRLTPTNYETQAAAASDLGGIEVSSRRLVITIGLETLTYKNDSVAIIIAAGEAKANIVAESIESEKSNQYPATALQLLPEARFYITDGAASRLIERRIEDIQKPGDLTDETIERHVSDLSYQLKKNISMLTKADFESDYCTSIILRKRGKSNKQISGDVEISFKAKIERGVENLENQVFLHTAPHHDDIMLAYLPYIVHLVRTPLNTHHFTYLTSGFTAVTNEYSTMLLRELKRWLYSDSFKSLEKEDYFISDSELAKNRDVFLYLDGVAYKEPIIKGKATSRRMLRNMLYLSNEKKLLRVEGKIDELINYFDSQYPGAKDDELAQKFKGMIREWEADLVWAYYGFHASNVHHLRLGFYKGDLFTEEPKVSRDVLPILKHLHEIKPTIITVAFDPEGSGPDTHYKVLQAVTEALKLYGEETDISAVKIWGYRNVWYRFHPAEADIFVPVSLNSMALMEEAFSNCFSSQKSASFPSYEFNGPFSGLVQKIWVEQYLKIKVCLGKDYFYENSHPRLRAAHGMLFLKELTPEEFYEYSRSLKRSTENN